MNLHGKRIAMSLPGRFTRRFATPPRAGYIGFPFSQARVTLASCALRFTDCIADGVSPRHPRWSVLTIVITPLFPDFLCRGFSVLWAGWRKTIWFICDLKLAMITPLNPRQPARLLCRVRVKTVQRVSFSATGCGAAILTCVVAHVRLAFVRCFSLVVIPYRPVVLAGRWAFTRATEGMQ